MAKEILTLRIRPELRKALIKEANKDKRTLSWYAENLLEEIAKRKKLEA